MNKQTTDPPPQTEIELPPPPPTGTRSIGCADYEFPPGLTPREIDILRLVIAEFNNEQVANCLTTSLHNVEKYLHRIQRKVDMYNPASPLCYLLKNR